MPKDMNTVELKDKELEKITGGIDECEFPEADELNLSGKEKKELDKDNKPKNKPKS